MSSDPLPEHRMPAATRRQRFGIVLALTLISAATAVSYFGTKDTWTVADSSADRRMVETSAISAALAWDFELPDGPHRQEFETSCLICHSARLPFGQPPFRREKWVEIVHKMVAVYGAPMTSEDEVKVVEYLLAVRPQSP